MKAFFEEYGEVIFTFVGSVIGLTLFINIFLTDGDFFELIRKVIESVT